ncbi:hypothetical protein ACFW1M_22315 [Streptomyces inhibens]|uniref:hypothetical protein n=1 Tax=Streptomyces inhibens TaxID=2293571 RepID=UPI0036795443
MGKRTNQNKSAKHVKQAKQRKAAAQRRSAAFEALLTQLATGEKLLETPWGNFTDTYATVGDAVAAAEQTGALSCFSFDDSGEYERGLRRGPDGWAYEVTLYPRQQLRELVKASWLNADCQDDAVEQLRQALADYAPDALRSAGIETVIRPSTTNVPRFGWTQSLPAAGLETWEDVRLAEKELPLFDLAPLAAGERSGDQYALTLAPEVFALFKSRGLAAEDCAGCGMPVTNRHPHWPGVWVAVEHEFGPCCDRSRLSHSEPLQRVGHIVDAADARPAQRPTGREQKVACQNCGARVTAQHPDWPGLWVDTRKYSDPVCAVVGNMSSDDAGEYDLLDCVYPHVPAGSGSPAAAAIAAAQKAGYFFRP